MLNLPNSNGDLAVSGALERVMTGKSVGPVALMGRGPDGRAGQVTMDRFSRVSHTPITHPAGSTASSIFAVESFDAETLRAAKAFEIWMLWSAPSTANGKTMVLACNAGGNGQGKIGSVGAVPIFNATIGSFTFVRSFGILSIHDEGYRCTGGLLADADGLGTTTQATPYRTFYLPSPDYGLDFVFSGNPTNSADSLTLVEYKISAVFA